MNDKKLYEYPYTYELIIEDEVTSVRKEINIYGQNSLETTAKLTIITDQLADWGLCPWIKKIGQAKEHTPEVKDLIEIINTEGFSIDEMIDAEIRLKELGVIEKKKKGE